MKHSRGASAKPKMPLRTRPKRPLGKGMLGPLLSPETVMYNSRATYGSPFRKAARASPEASN
eukprot:12439899-Alexandrium_andersonii.AAC.1